MAPVGCSIAPVGAYLAIAGTWSDPPAQLVVLAAAVLCWVAGFDILYSLQDLEFDRANGRHRVQAGLIYFLATAAIGVMLVYEQSLVRSDDFSRIDAAFFNINGAISVLFFAMVLLERVL